MNSQRWIPDMLQAVLVNMGGANSSWIARDLQRIFETECANIKLNSVHDASNMSISRDILTDRLQKTAFDVMAVILPRGFGEEECSFLRRFCTGNRNDRPVIAVIEDEEPDKMLEILRLGVSDFITLPVKSADMLPRIWRVIEHMQKKRSLQERLKQSHGLRRMIGDSPAFTAEVRKLPLVAGCDSSVLISGETGTGKEMFARAVHYLGPRAGKPFIPVNCGAIPPELIENELFGHVRGAFTGANVAHTGLVCNAEGGTLFLDEIDCLTLHAQVKLLRLLQEKEFRRLGSTQLQRSDIRVIAAANSDLSQAVEKGNFRQDLYYRLSIIRISIPPLRDRRGDIPLLARHFLEENAPGQHGMASALSPGAVQKLSSYHWPGNVRELENIIKRAVVFATGGVIQQEDIDLPSTSYPVHQESFQAEKAKVVAEFEKRYMQGLLLTHNGNITRAAKAAEKNRRAFWELIRKHNIDVSQYKPLTSDKQDS